VKHVTEFSASSPHASASATMSARSVASP
jgi:hypothetical protein